MDVFLPIAQVFVNPVEILLLSAIVGVLSGLFGVGGGFLMTPFLIFLGVPPAYAVANEANNILATSVSGSTTHYLKNTLDYKMGLMIVVGGVIGTSLGIASGKVTVKRDPRIFKQRMSHQLSHSTLRLCAAYPNTLKQNHCTG